jgi:hypothetical protein
MLLQQHGLYQEVVLDMEFPQNFPASFRKCTGNFRTHTQTLFYPSFETTGVGMQTKWSSA